jgi:hypothetical protein
MTLSVQMRRPTVIVNDDAGVIARGLDILVNYAASASDRDRAEDAADRAEDAADALESLRFATMAEAKSWAADGNSFVPGLVYYIAGSKYVGRTGATQLPGLPGLSTRTTNVIPAVDGPVGIVKGQHTETIFEQDHPGYLGSLDTIVNKGRPTSSNQIGRTLIFRSDEQGSPAWGEWLVISNPLPSGSGLTNEPIKGTPQGRTVTHEWNPQARSMDPGSYKVESALYSGNPAGGPQIVPETQDFSATLGDLRIGYNLIHGVLFSRSPYTANYGGTTLHARYLAMVDSTPNTVAADGYMYVANGGRDFLKAVTVSSAGSGYSVGDLLTMQAGATRAFNRPAQIKVLAVDGSGAITSAELYEAGGFTDIISGAHGVTGGTGSGATFTFTLSTSADWAAAALAGMGQWEYFIDGCAGGDARLYTRVLNAFMRLPNNQTIVGRNAANSADVEMLRVNGSNRVALAGAEVVPWTTYTPTITSQVGSITSAPIQNARWSRINNTVTVNVTFQIATISGAAGNIYVSIPVSAANYASGSGRDISSGEGLSAYITPASPARMEVRTSDNGGAIIAGNFYNVQISYEVAP